MKGGIIFTPNIRVISFAENPRKGGSPPKDIINAANDNFLFNDILEKLISDVFIKLKCNIIIITEVRVKK